MAHREEGAIRDQEGRMREDAGEELKDQYEGASAYEKDRIEARGIVFFTLGLLIMIGVTFGLMYALQDVMRDQAAKMDVVSPMAMSPSEQLPPEPRLQAAPGFEVRTENGDRINLELREPQSEYRELRKDWTRVWNEGRKDPNTGTIITLPIEEAKKKVLEGQGEAAIKARSPEEAKKAFEDARRFPSYMSSGRAVEVRRQ